MQTNLSDDIWQFCQAYVQAYQAQFSHLPLTEKDEQWPSPCEVGQYNDELITWQPVKIDQALSFSNVEQALGFSLHQDFCTYFTCTYSESMAASCSEGELSLLFPWNEEDFQRLQENLIGHVLMKNKLKQRVTLFFATTDDDNYLLSVDNSDGSVWVERVGREPHKKLADNLTSFIQSLTPSIYVED